MSRAVPRMAGHPTGMKHGGAGVKQPPQRIDFDYLDGLSAKAEKELRETEDALIAYIEQEQRREALYDDAAKKSATSYESKYPALRKEGVR